MNPASPVRFVPAFLACALAVLAAPLSAAVATASAREPSGVVLAANTPREPAATIGWKHDGAANQWTGITFTVVKDTTLDKIALAYAEAGARAAGARVTLRIVRLDTGAPSFAERIHRAEVLQADAFTLPSSLPAGGWLVFDIEDAHLKASPAPYAYILSFDDQAGGRFIQFTRGNGDATGVITVGADSAAIRSDTGETGFAPIGNARAGSAAFPLFKFLGTPPTR